jgi:MscS family membrane protein
MVQPGTPTVVTTPFLLLALLLSPPAGHGERSAGGWAGGGVDDWTGVWETRWRGGGARLILRQEGTSVSGTYPLLDGELQGTVEDRQLRGTWRQGERGGEFDFMLSRDGESFMGRFGGGEWWTGVRVDAEELDEDEVRADSPREAMRRFLVAAGDVGGGSMDRYRGAAALVRLPEATAGGGDRLEYVRLLHKVLYFLHFRIWDLPEGGEPGTDRARALLPDPRSGLALEVEFVLEGDAWRLEGPPEAELRGLRDALEALHGPAGLSEARLGRKSPRETMRTFLYGMYWFDGRADNPAYGTLDLSGVSDVVRDHEGPLLARYMQRVLDRIGFVIWQEIPNTEGVREPFVYFEHPAGNVILAAAEADDGAVTWRFTPETLRDIRRLYAAIEEMPVAPGLTEAPARDLHFRLRDRIRSWDTDLLLPLGHLERWQWLALVATLGSGLLLGLVLAGLGMLLRRPRRTRSESPLPANVRILVLLPLAMVGVAIPFLLLPPVLGLPTGVATGVRAAAVLALTLGAAPLLWILIGAVGNAYDRRTEGLGQHDTLVALVLAVSRILVVTGAFVLGAHALSVPYQGVLAGLGIGGLALALAARPTLENVISGLTLYADRPVAVGDFCRFGNQLGTVERIGLRSTRIRTRDRSVVSVPNSVLANLQIDNISARERVWFHQVLNLRYETTPDQLRALLEDLRTLLLEDARVSDDPLRVRFVGFGDHSLDIEIHAYVETSDFAESLAIREELNLRIIEIVEATGAQFAFPSQVHYLASDVPGDAEARRSAELRGAELRGAAPRGSGVREARAPGAEPGATGAGAPLPG